MKILVALVSGIICCGMVFAFAYGVAMSKNCSHDMVGFAIFMMCSLSMLFSLIGTFTCLGYVIWKGIKRIYFE